MQVPSRRGSVPSQLAERLPRLTEVQQAALLPLQGTGEVRWSVECWGSFNRQADRQAGTLSQLPRGDSNNPGHRMLASAPSRLLHPAQHRWDLCAFLATAGVVSQAERCFSLLVPQKEAEAWHI